MIAEGNTTPSKELHDEKADRPSVVSFSNGNEGRTEQKLNALEPTVIVSALTEILVNLLQP